MAATIGLLPFATAWALLLGGRIRDAWIVFGVGFHVGSIVLLQVDFLDYVVVSAAFYRLEDGVAWLGTRVRAWSSSRLEPIEVQYDGMCGLCVRAVTFLRGLDWLDRLRPSDGTAADGTRAQVFVAQDSEYRHEGFRAYRRIASATPALWPIVPLLYLPGASRLGSRVYEQIAANRGSSCSITAAVRRGSTIGKTSSAEPG